MSNNKFSLIGLVPNMGLDLEHQLFISSAPEIAVRSTIYEFCGAEWEEYNESRLQVSKHRHTATVPAPGAGGEFHPDNKFWHKT